MTNVDEEEGLADPNLRQNINVVSMGRTMRPPSVEEQAWMSKCANDSVFDPAWILYLDILLAFWTLFFLSFVVQTIDVGRMPEKLEGWLNGRDTW